MTRRLLSGLLLLVAAVAPAWAQTAPVVDPRVTAISPYVTDATAIVVRLNLRKVDLNTLAGQTLTLLPEDHPARAGGLKDGAKTINLMLKALVADGAGDVYLFAQATPEGGPGAPFIMAPIEAGKDPQAIIESLQAFAADAGTFFVHNNNVMFCPTDVVDKVKAIRGGDVTRFANAFKYAGQTDVQIIVAPTEAQLAKVADDPQAPLTDEHKELLKASKSLIITGNLPPKGALAAMLFMKDEASATKAATLLANFVQNELPPEVTKDPFMSRVIELVTPKQSGDSLRIILTDANGGITKLAGVLKDGVPEVTAAVKSGDLFLPPEAEAILLGADAARGRPRGPAALISSNNLKQIALAVHNFHDTYNGLPPQYSTTAEGKPLLSWRVAILPYIEQSALYDQFHLDEPWDSEHNKTLIAKMPDVYKSPYGDAGEGKTIYLGNGGKTGWFSPPTEHGMKWKPPHTFAVVVDGTSNTVMAIEAAEESAVVWTKPDTDYVWNEKVPFQFLPKRPDGQFTVAMGDGSVRKLKLDMKPQTWQYLLNREDGMKIEEE